MYFTISANYDDWHVSMPACFCGLRRAYHFGFRGLLVGVMGPMWLLSKISQWGLHLVILGTSSQQSFNRGWRSEQTINLKAKARAKRFGSSSNHQNHPRSHHQPSRRCGPGKAARLQMFFIGESRTSKSYRK